MALALAGCGADARERSRPPAGTEARPASARCPPAGTGYAPIPGEEGRGRPCPQLRTHERAAAQIGRRIQRDFPGHSHFVSCSHRPRQRIDCWASIERPGRRINVLYTGRVDPRTGRVHELRRVNGAGPVPR